MKYCLFNFLFFLPITSVLKKKKRKSKLLLIIGLVYISIFFLFFDINFSTHERKVLDDK